MPSGELVLNRLLFESERTHFFLCGLQYLQLLHCLLMYAIQKDQYPDRK